MDKIKFRYIVKRSNNHIFSRIFTLEELEHGEYKIWKEINLINENNIIIKDQYTNRNDRNRIDIYKGDICNIRRYDSKKYEVCEVRWGNNYGWVFRGYYGKRKKHWDYYGILFNEVNEIEVIGNITQHPDLI